MEEKNTKAEEKIENETQKQEDVKQDKVKTEKGSKKGLIIALIVIVLIAVIGAIIFFGIKYLNNNKTGSTWGDTYYAYLQKGLEETNEEERQKYGLQSGVEKAELQFVETTGEVEPVMLMSYDKDDKSYTNIYYINDQNSVASILNQEYEDAEYLYNIEKQEYNWYLRNESADAESYTNISNIINNTNQEKPEYVLDKNDKTEVELEDGNKVELTEFDKTFIKPDIEENNKQEIDIVDYVAQDIIDKINSLVSDYDKESDKINEEVQNKVNGLVQIAEEAISKTGFIKAGDYTLQFGSYKDKYGTEYILNADGTASCTSTELKSRNLENGKYVVYNYNDYKNEIDEWEKQNGPIGFSGEWMIAIGENVDKTKPYLTYSYSISGNNTFYNGQTDEVWTYQEETKKDSTAENKTTFKVGSYTLHYGTYKGTTSQYSDKLDRPVSYTLTFKFNQDGTYSIKSSNQSMHKDENGKFKVTKFQGMNVIELELDNGTAYYTSYGNDSIGTLAGASSTFEYQG